MLLLVKHLSRSHLALPVVLPLAFLLRGLPGSHMLSLGNQRELMGSKASLGTRQEGPQTEPKARGFWPPSGWSPRLPTSTSSMAAALIAPMLLHLHLRVLSIWSIVVVWTLQWRGQSKKIKIKIAWARKTIPAISHSMVVRSEDRLQETKSHFSSQSFPSYRWVLRVDRTDLRSFIKKFDVGPLLSQKCK